MWHLSTTLSYKAVLYWLWGHQHWWVNRQPYKTSDSLVNMSQGLSKKLVSVIITNVIAGALWTLACWCSRTTKWETQLFMPRPFFSKSHRELSHSATFPGKMWVNASPTPREYTKETLLPRSSLVNQWVLGGYTQDSKEAAPPETDSSVGITQRSCILEILASLAVSIIREGAPPPALVTALLSLGKGLTILELCKHPGSCSFISFPSLASLLPLRITLTWKLNGISYMEIL